MGTDPQRPEARPEVPATHASFTDRQTDTAAVVFLISTIVQGLLSKARFDRAEAAKDLWIATEALRADFPEFGPPAPVQEESTGG